MSLPTASSHARAARAPKAAKTVAVVWVSRAASIAIALVSVPLALSYLDQERYGLWILLASLLGYLIAFDLGFGRGLQNAVAEARGRDDREAPGRLLSTAFFAMLPLGLAVGAVGTGLAWVLPFGSWFHVSSPDVVTEFRWAFTATALTVGFLLPARMITSAQTGYQESYYGGMFGIAGSVMSLAALLLVIRLGGGLLALTVGTFVLAQSMTLVAFWHFFRRNPEARIRLARFDRSLLRPLWHVGWQFFALQIASVLIWYGSSFIIATSLGAGRVVPYATAFSLTWVGAGLLSSVPSALWPAYAEAKARGDWEWIRSAYRHTTLIVVLAAAGLGCLLFVVGADFILLWAGPKAVGPASMLAGLGVYLVAYIWTSCHVTVTNAMGRPATQVAAALAEAAVALTLSAYLISAYGLAGAGWGPAIGNAVTSAGLLAWGAWRSTGGNIVPAWKAVALWTIPPAAASLLAAALLVGLLPVEWPALARIAAASLVTVLPFVVAIGLAVARSPAGGVFQRRRASEGAP